MALLTRADITFRLRGANAHTDCGGVAVDSIKQALHLAVATVEDHDVIVIGGHMDVGSNLNPWTIL